jgi:hypothetical protein
MDVIFVFNNKSKLTAVNLHKVSLSITGNVIVLTELGCDHPSLWEVTDSGDIARLESWLVTNALGGELLIDTGSKNTSRGQ